MSARAEWAYLAECSICERRTSLDVPHDSPCGATLRCEHIVVKCNGTMLRRDIPRGDETEFPIGASSRSERTSR